MMRGMSREENSYSEDGGRVPWAPGEVVRVTCKGDTVDYVTVRPRWQDHATLLELHDQVMAALERPEAVVEERPLTHPNMSWDELMDLSRRLSRYNEARAAHAEPEEITLETRHIKATWRGGRGTLTGGDNKWAAQATAGALSEELTELLSGIRLGHWQDPKVVAARNDLFGKE